jgi:hypothetical protein
MATGGVSWDPDAGNKILMRKLEEQRLRRMLAGGDGGNTQPSGGMGGSNGPNNLAVGQADEDRRLAMQMAEAARARQEQSQNRQSEASTLSNLDEQRKRDAAARALALFQATGASGNQLAVGSARSQLM